MLAAVATRRPASRIRRRLWCGTALAMCMSAAGPAWAQAVLPNVANAGGATITSNTTTGVMTVDINGANRIVTYDSFNLGTPTSSSETLTFLNSGAAGSYSVLNRVTAGTGSNIHGSISAPSSISVWIVDPQGVTFGPTGSFSGGGLVVSTALLSGADQTSFLAGTLNALNGASTAPIIFQTGSGAISASGAIVVVGQQVTVNKTLTSSSGAVALVAATDVSFTDINSPLSITIGQGTTLATGVQVGAAGDISGQSIRLAGGVDGAVTAALLQVDPGASLTATAAGGSIVLATDSTPGITIANSPGDTPGISAGGTFAANGANGDITVTGAGAVDLTGSLSAGRNIVLSSTDAAAGSVTVAGNVTTGSDYQVDARDITLGANAATVTQQAGGAIRINAANDALGRGTLALRSNTDETGAEALSITAGSGAIDFAGTTSLTGGTAADRADVVLTSGSDISAGTITARALLDSGSLTDLTAPGALTLGNVTTDSALRLTSTGGAITTGDLVSNNAGVRIEAQAGDIVGTGITAADDITAIAQDNIRLAMATSTAGSISLTATTGAVTGTPLGAPAGDGRLLPDFGRTNLTAATAGETISVSAAAGTAQLGALSAGAGAADLGADQIAVTAQAIDLLGATAINGHVDLQAAGIVRAGTLSAGTGSTLSDVIVGSTGAVTVSGAVTASRDYGVTGSTVTLGGGTQAARGAVTIRADSGAVTGLGTLTLQSNSDGTGGEALYLNAVAGAVDFASGSTVLGGLPGGTAAQRSAVQITSAPTLRLGNVTGSSLRSFGNATDLTATGAITTGNVTVDQALRIISTGGSIEAGNLDSAAGGVLLQATGNAQAGIVTARDAVSLTATGDLSLVSAESTTGSIALNAGGAVGGLAGGRTDLTANGAGQTIQVTAGGAARIGSASAGSGAGALGADQILVTAGSIDLDGATAVNGNVHLVANSGTLRAGALSAGTPTILADVVASASGAATVGGAVSAARDYGVTGASVTLGDAGGAAVSQTAGGTLTASATAGNLTGSSGLTLHADGDVALGASGTTTVPGAVSAGGNYSVSGTSVMLGGASPATQSAGGLLSVTATGNVLSLAGLTLQSGSDLTVVAGGDAEIRGPVSATGNYAVSGTNVTLGAGTAATQAAGGLLSVTATGGGVTSLTGLTLQAGTDVTVIASGDAALAGPVSATGDYTVTGTSVTLGSATPVTQSAGGLLGVTATGDILGLAGLTLQSGSDLTVSAGGTAEIQGGVAAAGNYSVSGTGVTLGTTAAAAQSAGGLLTVTATGGNVLGRSGLSLHSDLDVTVGATGTVTLAGPVSATGSYSVTGSGVTLGSGAAVLQAAGGPLTITATGGDVTGLAGLALQSGTDVTVIASGGVTLAGPVSALGDYSVTGTGITLGDASGTAVLQSASGLITVTATTGGVLGRAGLTLQSGGNTTIGANSAVTIAGAVSALGDYSVTGTSVALGGALASTQSAGGLLTVNATAGDATGLAGLTLHADLDATVSATGAVTIAGPVSALGDYSVTGTSVALGDPGGSAVLQSAGGLLSVAATGGTLSGSAGLTLQSGGDTILSAGGAATLRGAVSSAGNYSVTAASVALGDAGAPATQSAGGLLTITATGGDVTGLTGLTLQAGSDATVAASGDAALAGPVSAVGNYSVTGTNVTLGSATPVTQSAGGTLSVTATGDMLGLAGLTLQSGGGVTVTAAGAAEIQGAVTAAGNYAVTGSGVTLGSGAAASQSAGGLVTISATGGDVLGRTGLTLHSDLDLAVGATGGVTLSGPVSALGSYAVTGAGVTLGSGATVLHSAGGPLTVTATSGDVTGLAGLTLQSGGDLTVDASGNASLAGPVSALGAYSVTATDIMLGDAAMPVTQSATGLVAITASGNITGLGGLRLQSNSDGAGAEALTLDAGGAVSFAPSSSLAGGLEAGPAGARSDILIRSAPTLALGTVTGRSLRSIGDPTDLTAAGAITLGNVTTDQALAVRATGGSIAAGDVTVLGAGQSLRLSAGGGAGDVASGTLQTNGGDIALSAGRDIAAAAIRTAPSGDPATGTIAILAGRDIALTALAAGEDIALSGGGALAFDTARAGDDIDIAASGTVTLVSATSTGAGSDARAVQFDRALAGQPGGIAFAGAGGQAGHNLAIRAAGLTSPAPLGGENGTGLVVRSLTGGTDATLAADQGDIRIGTLEASGNIGVTAGQGSVSGLDSNWAAGAPSPTGGPTLQAPGAILLEGVGAADFAIGSITAQTISTGASTPANLRLGTVRAGSLDLTAGTTLQIDDAQITGAANLRTTGGSAGAFSLTAPSLADGHGRADLSGANILVTAAGAAQLGIVSAEQNLGVTAAAIDLDEATAALGSLALETGSGRLTLGTGSAGTDAILVKEDAEIGLPKTAADNLLTAGTVSAGGIASFRSETSATIGTATASGGDLTVNARDDATIGTGTANAGAIRVLAGRDAAATTLTAEDIAVRAGNAANLGTLDAADNLDLAAGGALAVLSGHTLGGGTDDRSFTLDPALAGADNAIAPGATPAADGDIRLVAGSVTLGELDSAIGNIAITATAGDVIGLPGNGSVSVHGAGKSISVTALAGNVQLGPLSAGQGSSVLVGTQIDVTAQVIDLLTATATNGGLALTATEGSLTLGTGSASGGATLTKQGAAGELSVASLATGQDIAIQSDTSARLGTIQSDHGALSVLARNGPLTLDAGTAGAGATLTKQGGTGDLTVTSLTAAQDIVARSDTSAQFGTIQSTGGALDLATTGGALTLDTGTAGTGATITKQGGTGDLTVASLTAAQDIVARSDTGAQFGTIRSTGGALTLATTGGALTLDTGTAGTNATITKQGGTGELAIGSLTAGQDIAAQSQTGARIGTIRSGNGGIALLAQGEVTGLAGDGLVLDAFEDAAISAGGDVRIDTIRAGDDLSIDTPAAVTLVSAIADGSAGDTRTIVFDRTRIGEPGGVAFGAEPAVAPLASGSNITIRAASLGGPALTGDTDAGLVIGTLNSGDATLSSAEGDIRADTITASGGDLSVTAARGSVSGRRTGFQSATGGSIISAQDRLTLDVSGDVTAGTVTAGTLTNAGMATPASIRLGSVTADTLALTAANGLQIDTATVTGSAMLGTTGGAANASLAGYGASALTAQGAGKAIAVEAGATAQLGALQAGGAITAKAGAARIGSARAQSGDIVIEAKTGIALLGAVETVDAGRSVTLGNAGTGGTIVGGSAADNGTDIVLDNAEIGQVATGNLVIDSKARPVTIEKLAIGANTGRTSFRILSTGAILLNDTISGDGTGTLQIGGGSIDDPVGLVDEAQLASQIAADIGESGTRAAILMPNGIVDLRARRIVFARAGLVERYLPAGGGFPSDSSVAIDVANAASPLYTADGTGRQFLTAKRLRVSYANFALFQNTGGPNGAGVALNESSPPTVTGLALQLFGPGDGTDNSFALFGTVNGFIGRAAGILPNEILEIWSPVGARVVRISQGNARLNGCVIGSPDKGCLVNDPPRPNFSIYDQRQTQLFGIADDPLLFFNPLVGRGNEGLIVDIADAPVGIDTIECDPANGPCGQGEPK